MSRLRIENISKRFPGVNALTDVSFTVEPGEVHALCGENGAGKTTLMSILSGNLRADSGIIRLDNKEIMLKSPRDAFSHGIAIVHQHLSLVESLNVAENIFANDHPVNAIGVIRRAELYLRAERLLEWLDIPLKPRTPVSRLSPAEKQLTEIAKALARKPRILILDEPTAALTDRETSKLFRLITRQRQEGVSIIYISHRLHEIEAIADSVSVLKDGRFQGTFRRDEVTRAGLIRAMVGRELSAVNRGNTTSTEVALKIENLSAPGLKNVSFKLLKGEILGLAGLAGAGRTEIAKAIFGFNRSKGSVTLNGKRVSIRNPADALRLRLAYVPEERKSSGLFEGMSVLDNMLSAKLEVLPDHLYRKNLLLGEAGRIRDALRIATPNMNQKVLYLSGGNQQKVVLARWLLTEPEILIVDEPTHGVDVGAKNEIYGILSDLAARGKSIVMISSELPELLALCHRILVVKTGTIVGELSGEEATEEKIMQLAT